MAALYNWLFPTSRRFDVADFTAPSPKKEKWVLVSDVPHPEFLQELSLKLEQLEVKVRAVLKGPKQFRESMEQRVKAFEILTNLVKYGEEADELIERVQCVSRKLLGFETAILVDGSAEVQQTIEGVSVTSGISLIDTLVAERDQLVLKDLVSDFEAVAYGTMALYSFYHTDYVPAKFRDVGFKITNFCTHSLGVSMRNRMYGYQLLSHLTDQPELSRRIKAALQCMVEFENKLKSTPQVMPPSFPSFRGEQITPGKGLIEEESSPCTVDYRSYLARKVSPNRLKSYLKKKD